MNTPAGKQSQGPQHIRMNQVKVHTAIIFTQQRGCQELPTVWKRGCSSLLCEGELFESRAAPSYCPPPAGLAVPPHGTEQLCFVGIPPWSAKQDKNENKMVVRRMGGLANSLGCTYVALSTSTLNELIWLESILFICSFIQQVLFLGKIGGMGGEESCRQVSTFRL